MKILALAGVLAIVGLSLQPNHAPQPRVTMPAPPSPRALTGEPPTCQGGCSQVVPEWPRLPDARVRELLDAGPAAMVECLFYGDSVRSYLEKHGVEAPEPLRREMSRRAVRVEFHMADEAGTLDVRLSKVYRLGEKRRHLADSAVGVQEPRLSLILQRVDVDRLWTRT